LLDVLEVHSQAGLLPERRVDRLTKSESLAGFKDDFTSFGCLFGRGDFVLNVKVSRRKNSLGKVFRVAVPLVAATEWGDQQEESEKL
jgi:hypothetical protein